MAAEVEWKDDDDVLAEEEEERKSDALNYNSDGLWLGKCLDDGTGRDVYFVSPDGNRSRRAPKGYVPEKLLNGERKYYYRGNCIRCRKQKQAAVFLSAGPGEFGFSCNLCPECHIKQVPGTTRLRGNGDVFYRELADVPKNQWLDLSVAITNPDRSSELLGRALEARRAVREDMKRERNKQRFINTRRIAREYGVDSGEHISWGWGDTAFDEYYGTINDRGEPHGMGMKVYSDGSVYYGGFQNGEHHTEKRGVWSRPDGSVYDGSWQFGQRHGTGTQIYPAGGRYEGQFAKGFEHGQGKRAYADGSTFDGRFRFGRKDGLGTFTDKDGKVEKGTFAPDPAEKYNEKAPPIIEEEDNPNEDYFQPPSLLDLSISALSKAMHTARDKYAPARKLTLMLPQHVKTLLAADYLRTMSPPGSAGFLEHGPRYAFTPVSELVFQGVRMSPVDCLALMYFQGCNPNLRMVKMTSNNLELSSLDLICQNVTSGAWPVLSTLDLSFNAFDVAALEQLLRGVKSSPTIRHLRLASCQIKSAGFFALSRFLAEDARLLSLDVAFNLAEPMGAELISDALTINGTLTSLNLRSNRLGQLGGSSLCTALAKNRTLRVLCVADNGCDAELLALVSGRLNGGFGDVVKGVLINELELPFRYYEGRYDFFKRRVDKKNARDAEATAKVSIEKE